MTQEVSLDSLKEDERELILQVLHRDEALQKTEEERIRGLKAQLQQVRWTGARASQEPAETCARCRRALGRLLRRGAVCRGCSHRVCTACRVAPGAGRAWKCTVCFEDRNVKIKTGDWFFEERAKKFPAEGKHETAGAKLLQSYQRLSYRNLVSLKDLIKLSKSQNDMTLDKHRLATGPGQRAGQTERRSRSDTAIAAATRKSSTPDIPKPLTQEDLQPSTDPILKPGDSASKPTPDTFSGGLRHGSLVSINSTCTEMGNFDNADVTGEIEFAIRYCFKTHSLEICIRACKNLAYGEEKKKKCNPYVKTYLLPDRSSQGKRKTRAQKNTVDPTFQETMKYPVEPAQLGARQLQVSVWHLGVLARRVFLGQVLVPLATWNFEDLETQDFRWYPLRAKAEGLEDSAENGGELAVRAKLVLPPGPRKLQEVLEGGRNLRAEFSVSYQFGAVGLHTGVWAEKSFSLPHSARPTKTKTQVPVLKRQACPQWKHSFVFDGVSPSQLKQSSLELTVWDQAAFGMNDRLLGRARLGSREGPVGGSDLCSQSKLQWQKVLSSPNLWTDMTLTLH